jgi:hypothetical protein
MGIYNVGSKGTYHAIETILCPLCFGPVLESSQSSL